MNVSSWSVLSSDQCRKMSVAAITNEKTPKSLDASECVGTLYDARMGPRFEGDRCGTCGESFKTCKLGHYGIIEFGGMCVFVNNYLPHVLTHVRTVCKHCRRAPSKKCPMLITKPCKTFKFVGNEKNGTIKVDDEVWTATETKRFLETCAFPGKPENMIFENVLVLSNCSRPMQASKKTPRTVLRAHRYTEPYAKILRTVKSAAKLDEAARRYLNTDLYAAVNALLINNAPGRAGTTQVGMREEDMSGVLSSIVSKRGLIRNNLMGKRVDFSARGVAAGDPTLRVDEFGLPRVWRTKLTIPVRVFDLNLSELMLAVEAGEWTTIIKHGGTLQYDSECVPKSDFKRIAHWLAKGDVVERWLKDGDPVMLIRQPTLHKGSMMCGKARLHDRHTVEMNVNVTTPYNGDFDGDEFNVFVPRSDAARAEFELLFSVKHHIVNENGECQIYPIQNAVLGMYRATLENPEFFPRIGRGVATKEACRDRIRDIWFDEGPDAAVDAIQEISDAANAWLNKRGASVGLNEFDCARLEPPHESDGALLRAQKIRARAVMDNLENPHYNDEHAFNEASVYLNSIDPYDKSLQHMKRSGCKGTSTNELNVALVMGRQYVADVAPRPFFGGTHILPCGLSRGFVPRGLIRGLKPEHTALLQMSGRYGVYTKSVGVQVSGQRYRQMAQCLENLVVSPTASVLDESGDVVQLVYGEDGLDPKFVRPSGLPTRESYDDDGERESVPEFLRNLSEKSQTYFSGRDAAPAGAIRDWARAAVPYGHAVGIIAAQSIGEPATQELLNKIHLGEKNQNKINLSRLFKPGKGGEIYGRAVGGPIPPVILSWSVTKERPPDTEWTRRYERYEPFPFAAEYLVLKFDREVDLVRALELLPNRRSTHPALDVGEFVEVHVALTEHVDGVLSKFGGRHPKISAVRKNGDELVCEGDFAHVLAQPWIEGAWCDDACVVAEVLGIDAARAMLLQAFTKTFGSKVDVRHVMLMVDAMTYTGAVRSVDFYGFKKGSHASVLGRACFMQSLPTFFGSAVEGFVETDRKQNVSESVVTGSMSVLGTGGVCSVMDLDALERFAPEEEEEDPERLLGCGGFLELDAFAPSSPNALDDAPDLDPEDARANVPFSPAYVEGDDDEGPAYVPTEEPWFEPSTPTYDYNDAGEYDPFTTTNKRHKS